MLMIPGRQALTGVKSLCSQITLWLRPKNWGCYVRRMRNREHVGSLGCDWSSMAISWKTISTQRWNMRISSMPLMIRTMLSVPWKPSASNPEWPWILQVTGAGWWMTLTRPWASLWKRLNIGGWVPHFILFVSKVQCRFEKLRFIFPFSGLAEESLGSSGQLSLAIIWKPKVFGQLFVRESSGQRNRDLVRPSHDAALVPQRNHARGSMRTHLQTRPGGWGLFGQRIAFVAGSFCSVLGAQLQSQALPNTTGECGHTLSIAKFTCWIFMRCICLLFQIEKDGMMMLSLDAGHTKFTDLIQLVDFYQLNAAGLPTNLTHYVTRLAWVTFWGRTFLRLHRVGGDWAASHLILLQGLFCKLLWTIANRNSCCLLWTRAALAWKHLCVGA